MRRTASCEENIQNVLVGWYGVDVCPRGPLPFPDDEHTRYPESCTEYGRIGQLGGKSPR